MTVVLLDPRRPTLIPAEALSVLRGPVEFTDEVAASVRELRPAADESHAPAVLVTTDRDHPAVRERIAAGETLIAARPVPGEHLLDAVAVMDRLRGGSWESRQTHESLRRYLLEETYELLDAVHSGDRAELREELGDLLLQVLFHARIAADAAADPFDIDDVADTLVAKLNNRAPRITAEDGTPIDAETRNRMWEERKAAEKRRASCLDGIAMAQPALALAQKVLGRAMAAGVPPELVPAELIEVRIAVAPPEDDQLSAEDQLRKAVLEFADRVRRAERSAAASRRQTTGMNAAIWRAHWP
ncbi:MazG family protein [Speluncibacter jeojiensis]|uniref:MazG family protein n=1 Tax=Speluncibacter jeojiensis TaxID=2710754 RepID=A0A9X4M019_9ACTN|nr:MazG family protein [Corynebacteriales bacterium D3-21]